MSKEKISMSDWEWDGVMHTPERQEAAEKRYAKERQDRAEKEGFLCNFYEKTEQRRKTRVEIEACRYTVGAMIAGVLAWFCGAGGIKWLCCVLVVGAIVLALIAAYGFGKVQEMGRSKRKAASRSSSPESGKHENTYINTVTEEEDEVNVKCIC